MKNRFYFINQRFECWWIPYTDLCIIEWISQSDFHKILNNRQNERLKECENWEHWEWFYDRLAFDIEQLWWKLECITDENIYFNS